jgi:YHS domain-containing protein
MADLTSLLGRLDTELNTFQKSAEQFQVAAKGEYEAREKRFRSQFVPAAERVVSIIRPRLEVLVERFNDRISVVPVVTEHERDVTLRFNSPLARIDLLFRLGHDAEVKSLVLEQNLEILPILMKFDSHASLTVPLDKIDDDKIAHWIDDRIVSFVKTVAALHQNQYYLKDHLEMDPIAGVQMPKYAAKCTLDTDGKTYYFISDETRAQFAKERKIALK